MAVDREKLNKFRPADKVYVRRGDEYFHMDTEDVYKMKAGQLVLHKKAPELKPVEAPVKITKDIEETPTGRFSEVLADIRRAEEEDRFPHLKLSGVTSVIVTLAVSEIAGDELTKRNVPLVKAYLNGIKLLDYLCEFEKVDFEEARKLHAELSLDPVETLEKIKEIHATKQEELTVEETEVQEEDDSQEE